MTRPEFEQEIVTRALPRVVRVPGLDRPGPRQG